MFQGKVLQKTNTDNDYGDDDTTTAAAVHCHDPTNIDHPGVKEAAVWLPTLVTRYKSASEILATDSFFQDYKYFYGQPECAQTRVIDERFK